jgi:hypothetical protein
VAAIHPRLPSNTFSYKVACALTPLLRDLVRQCPQIYELSYTRCADHTGYADVNVQKFYTQTDKLLSEGIPFAYPDEIAKSLSHTTIMYVGREVKTMKMTTLN